MLLLILFLLGPSSGMESGKTRACDVLMVIDSPLFELYDKNMSAVVELAQDHINGLNEIFFKELFVDDYQSLYFFLKRVQVAFGSCDSPLFEEGYDSNCTTQRGNYLKNFDDKTDTHEFCLAYMLTYLDFHNGTAGLASIGTLCRPKQNTGFVTLLNYGQERSLEESVITFAHEVAHNLNAIHDNDHEDDPECFQKGYIMDELLNVETSSENSKKFSNCSIKAMHKTLDTLETDCFRDQIFDVESPLFQNIEISLCGNMVVEAGEECDCGFDIFHCNDPCCYPAQIPAYERSANHSARGPLWMMVNITIFGNEQTMTEMIIALESALDDMSREYCSQEPRLPEPTTDGNTCDLEEINAARQFIADIDVVISESLFKTEDDEARKKAMLGFIELKSAMDDRVRQLFNDNLKCHDEVKQLKNVYMDEITNCLAEMMNPRYRFEELTRAERVACIKGLRVTIEDRRGELLMKEIERRISEQSSNAEYEA